RPAPKNILSRNGNRHSVNRTPSSLGSSNRCLKSLSNGDELSSGKPLSVVRECGYERIAHARYSRSRQSLSGASDGSGGGRSGRSERHVWLAGAKRSRQDDLDADPGRATRADFRHGDARWKADARSTRADLGATGLLAAGVWFLSSSHGRAHARLSAR